MRLRDLLAMAFCAVAAQRLRARLTIAGIALGTATVVVLTALGRGMHDFVINEFSQFGTGVVAITPGARTTLGMSGALVNTVRPLTLADAGALRRLPGVLGVSPVISGNAAVEWSGRSRRTWVHGVGAEAPGVWKLTAAEGRFLPAENPARARPLAVLGSVVARELFGTTPAVGQRLRIGGSSFRVVGVAASKGQFLGFDLDDAVYIPAARAEELFDREGMMEIDVQFAPDTPAQSAAAAVARLLEARHGRIDFTVTPQQQMMDSLGSVLTLLELAVVALGGVSLFVGGIGVLTLMTLLVRERRGEIGTLLALGAPPRLVRLLFLCEAALLAGSGGVLGWAVGQGGALLLGWAVPALPVAVSPLFAVLAIVVSVSVGLVAGVVPAARAARLDPLEALRAE